MIKRYDVDGVDECSEGGFVRYADHMAEVERIKSTYSKDEIEMAKIRAQELRLKLFPEIVFKEELDKLTEQNRAMRLAIEHYLEVQKFLAAPDEDTCASSNDFRECLKGLE